MIRTIRLVGVAAVGVMGSLVVGPAGPAGAATAPTAVIKGSRNVIDRGDSLVCAYGQTLQVYGDDSENPDGGDLQYEWFGTLDGSTPQNPRSYRFDCDFEGSKEVGLRVTNEAGLEGSVVVPVYSNRLPLVSLNPAGVDIGDGSDDPVVYGTVGESVTFTATVSDPENTTVTSEWFIENSDPKPDPGVLTATVPCYSDSQYFVAIVATDEVGLENYAQVRLRCYWPTTGKIDPAPRADGRRTVVPVGTRITFKQTSYATLAEYAWRTTGVPGIASTEREFTRTFDTPGEFGVHLTESNAVGSGQQWVGYTVVGPPTVSVSPAPANPAKRLRVPLGSTVNFQGTASTNPGAGSLTYQWRTSGVRGVAGEGQAFARRFDKIGNVGVELIVGDELGQSSKRRVEVTVFKSEPPVVAVSPAPPDPKGRMKIKVGSSLTFDGRGSRDPDGGSLQYEWRTTGVRDVAGTANTYSRKFDKVGNYGVELTVIDDEGQRAKRWVGLTVEP